VFFDGPRLAMGMPVVGLLKAAGAVSWGSRVDDDCRGIAKAVPLFL